MFCFVDGRHVAQLPRNKPAIVCNSPQQTPNSPETAPKQLARVRNIPKAVPKVSAIVPHVFATAWNSSAAANLFFSRVLLFLSAVGVIEDVVKVS
jgi:hypothetical protein